ncbi:MAG: folylpolyglutamate synthase/dihydrofolate synthase family protein [Thermodesulfobacteriota bacterium]
MTYDETIAWLVGLEATRGWDLKLERMRDALARLGSPERRYPAVLIAGTNGKGSTAAMAHAALGAAGRRTGLYTSPHLVHFTERIRIRDAEIARDDVVRLAEKIRSTVDVEGTGLTFFEVTTLLALLAFAEAAVDLAVLEVGLGGRLDATNVVEPIASAVTAIDYDHEDWLGDTLADIAREKAGVMRPGRPVVLGPGIAAPAREALLEQAARIGARVVEVKEDAAASVHALALSGDHMRRNAAVAGSLLEVIGAAEPRLAIDAAALARGLRTVRWPGRLAVVHAAPRVIVDGAHNVQGVLALRAALPAVAGAGPVRLLFSALRDKHWREMAELLQPVAREVVVTEVGGKRGLSGSELAGGFRPAAPPRVIVPPAAALSTLIAEDRDTPVLVTGSLFLVGRIYAELMERAGAPSVYDFVPPGAA